MLLIRILFFNWMKTALRCCVGFCHTTIIIHNDIYNLFFFSLPPLPPSHPSRLSQSARLLYSVCYMALAIHFTHDSVYMLILNQVLKFSKSVKMYLIHQNFISLIHSDQRCFMCLFGQFHFVELLPSFYLISTKVY